ncbi:MAG: hypothetical protein IPK19_29045 [Chloroflexi bacterium]|nr:hypothetical protein [Chloroflexota bacterium]
MFDLNNILFARQIVEKMSEEHQQYADQDYDPASERPRLITRLWNRIAGTRQLPVVGSATQTPSRHATEAA